MVESKKNKGDKYPTTNVMFRVFIGFPHESWAMTSQSSILGQLLKGNTSCDSSPDGKTSFASACIKQETELKAD